MGPCKSRASKWVEFFEALWGPASELVCYTSSAGPPQHHIIIFDRCYIITFDSHAKLHAFREILPQCQSATSFPESRTSYKKQITVAILQITKCFIPVLQNGSKFPVLQNGSIMSNLQGVAVFQKEKRKIGFSQRPLADSSHRLVECSLIC